MKLLGILFFSILFLLKVADQSCLSMSPLAIEAPGSVRNYPIDFTHTGSLHMPISGLLILLFGDIALNPCPEQLFCQK